MYLGDNQNTDANRELIKKIDANFLRVELYFKDQHFLLSRDDLPFIVGREDSSCHVVNNSATTSRIHCIICFKEHRIGILDQSKNGTAVKLGRSEPVLVHNEFFPLSGQGYIKPGAKIELTDNDLIMYKVITR